MFFGNGDGTFQSPTNYKDSGANQLIVADVDSNGSSDIVTVDAMGITVLLNEGNKQFTFVKSSAAGLAGSFIVGDFNNDGKPDVAISGLGIFLGNGNGTFRAPSSFFADGSTASMAAADINNDHKLDIVQIYKQTPSQGVQIFFGGGNGTLRGPREFVANGPDPCIRMGDFNNDGYLDIASLSCSSYGNNTVSVLLGNGDGTFRAPLDSYSTSGGFAFDIAVGDFNQDGKLDLAVLNSTQFANGVLNIFLGNGDGTLQSPILFTVSQGITAQRLAVGDFNRDGVLDIAVTSACSSINSCKPGVVSILIGNGDGTFKSGGSYLVGDTPEAIIAADFNNDGATDLAVANLYSGSVSIFLANGDGTFDMVADLVVTEPNGLLAADFNGDGNQDVAIVSANSTLYVALGEGTGQFGQFLNGVSVDSVRNPVASDFNGDGILDVATDGGQILVGMGGGKFQSATNLGPDAGGFVQAATLGNDFLPDIVYGTGLPVPITVLVNLGNSGTF